VGLFLGFDPGGAGAFGWCVTENRSNLPLPVRASGVADNAEAAVGDALFHVRADEAVEGVGIDAPLFWVACDDRRVDQLVRAAVRRRGGRTSTVQHVNSLRGACLVQGVLAGMLLRRRFAGVPISEAHPKAYLWVSGTAQPGQPPSTIGLSNLSEFQISGIGHADHVRDAAIATLSGWALVHRPPGWSDLYLQEINPQSPLAAPLGYWMPM
jgi:Protein of unknown function (DUF429)